jgi:hypothetical protein
VAEEAPSTPTKTEEVIVMDDAERAKFICVQYELAWMDMNDKNDLNRL